LTSKTSGCREVEQYCRNAIENHWMVNDHNKCHRILLDLRCEANAPRAKKILKICGILKEINMEEAEPRTKSDGEDILTKIMSGLGACAPVGAATVM